LAVFVVAFGAIASFLARSFAGRPPSGSTQPGSDPMLDQLASPERAPAPPVVASAPRRRGALAAGLMLVVVGVPLVLTPFTTAPFSDGKLVLLLAGTLLVAIGCRGRPLDRGLVLPA